MTFVQLYSTRLNIELGSDQTTLFTTVLRKQAINDAMDAWVRVTGCTKRYGSISISDGVGEYDLEASFTDYIRLAGDPSIKIVNGSDTRWIQGLDAFPKRDPEELDRLEPNWRAAPAGTPAFWYIREDGGSTYLGGSPAPDITAPEVWTWSVPYVASPTALSADADVPFTISSGVIARLTTYHQALAHYGAAVLEPLRKNYAGAQRQMGLFAGFVAQYETRKVKDGSDQVTFARNYYEDATSAPRAVDQRRYP